MNRLATLILLALFTVVPAAANAFTFVEDLGGGNGTVFDFSNPAGAFDLSFILIGSDSDQETSIVTTYTATATAARTVTGEFSYLSNDVDGPDLDPFGYLLNGERFQLTDDDGAAAQTGTFSFLVAVGDVFGWYIDATDDALGAASVNVGASFVPAPAALPLFGSALLGLTLLRRRAD